MPAFNYENPRNAAGEGMESPQERLLSTVIEILAYESQRSLTREALLKQDFPEDMIDAYGSAEELCHAALLDAAERIRLSYETIAEEVADYLNSADKTRDRSYMYLERLLYRHIYLSFHPKNRKYVLACARESSLPEGLGRILPEAVGKYVGEPLAQLILEAGEVKNRQMAALLACSICGSILTFVQQPLYCQEIFRKMTKEKPNYAVVEDFLNNIFLRSVSANTGINKLF